MNRTNFISLNRFYYWLKPINLFIFGMLIISMQVSASTCPNIVIDATAPDRQGSNSSFGTEDGEDYATFPNITGANESNSYYEYDFVVTNTGTYNIDGRIWRPDVGGNRRLYVQVIGAATLPAGKIDWQIAGTPKEDWRNEYVIERNDTSLYSVTFNSVGSYTLRVSRRNAENFYVNSYTFTVDTCDSSSSGTSGTGTTSSSDPISNVPLFVSRRADPITMLTMSKDHQLYKKAFSDYEDVNSDGVIDNGYNDVIDYYGYFDNKKCYNYSTADSMFIPDSVGLGTYLHECDGTMWSGNFLNWATMTRMDVLRKALYGGKRDVDDTTTVLERAYIPPDIHSFSKVYEPSGGATDVNKYTPYSGYSSISICNVSDHTGSTESQSVTADPVLRVANGSYPLWAAGEVSQCIWGSSSEPNVPDTTNQVEQIIARVQVCVSGILESNCQTYPNGNRKPTGLLHSFGTSNQGESTIKFGLLTGSYESNLSGGVLRRNPYFLSGNLDGTGAPDTAKDEVDTDTGQFINQADGDEGIINTVNRFRISNYAPSRYNDCNTFSIPVPNEGSTTENCGNWGNPLGEMYMETLRFIAGDGNSPTSTFNVDDGPGYITGIPNPSWEDPYTSDNWCASPSVVLVSTGLNSFDEDQFSSASDIPGISSAATIDASTNRIGVQEGISGNDYFVGENGTTNDGVCSAKTVTNLSDVQGLCPEDPALEGTFSVAGLALHARTNNIRPDVTPTGEEVNVNTYSLALAEGLPRITLNGISFVPTCQSKTGASNWINCSPADLRIRSLNFDADDNLTSGEVVIVWEDSSWGNDYDKDGIQHLAFCAGSACSPSVPDDQVVIINSNPNHNAGNGLHYGYAVGGSTNDGLVYNIQMDNGSSARDCLLPSLALDGSCSTVVTTGSTVAMAATGSGTVYPQNISTYTAGTSKASLLNAPLWYAAKYGSFNEGSATPNDIPDEQFEWDSDANGVPDNYFQVTDPSQLEAQLSKVFESILETNGSSSAVASNTTSLQTDTRVYQALFDSGVWTGDLLAIPVNADGSFEAPVWSAATQIDNQNYNTSRVVLSYDPAAGSSGQGIPFRWADLGASQRSAIDTNAISKTFDGRGEDRTNYIRGDRSHEIGQGPVDANFRARSNVLGDFVDSAPFFVGEPLSGYPDTIETDAYSAYALANSGRTPVIYIGSNDGMMHAINANTGDSVFGYVPNEVVENLNELTDPGYSHNFYVNASPVVTDAYFDSDWHTVLLSGLGAGGKAMFALDVTDPSAVTEVDAPTKVLWEISSSDSGFADLGFTYTKPSIVKLTNGTWAAIFSNGYNSDNGKAVLYIVNIETGALIQAFDVGVGSTSSPNGLGTPAVVDSNGDYIADLVYAGDLAGNVWRFDLTASSPTSYTFSKFFEAENSESPPDSQSIVTKMEVGQNPFGGTGTMIYFGTGKYFTEGDAVLSNAVIESFYGIIDENGTAVTRSQLLEQTIVTETSFIFPGSGTDAERTFNVRVTSDNDLTTEKGWYMDLVSPANGFEGERVITDAILRNGRIAFTTLIPSSSQCDSGGSGWVMALNADDGSRPDDAILDLNNDGVIDSSDLYNDGLVSWVVTGFQTEGIPRINVLGGGEIDHIIVNDSGGNLNEVAITGGTLEGRLSWQQLK